MIQHYLKIAWRHIRKHPMPTFINVFGLSVAIAFCLLIYLFVKHEQSYDTFHAKADRIMLVTEINYDGGKENKMIYLPLPLAAVLKQEMGEVKNAVRFTNDRVVIRRGDKVFPENAHFTDEDFFKMFSFPLVKGNAETALNQQNSVVLTPKLAAKYFGNENPIGKIININIFSKEEPFIVSGIAETPPSNSSLTFDLLVRSEKRAFYERSNKNWQSFSTPTFIELAPEISIDQFKKKVAPLADKYFVKTVKYLREHNKFAVNDKVLEISASSLASLHLNTDLHWENASNPKYTYILSGIALLILLIASLNYVSLALSSSSGRSVEVGIRKVNGAGRRELIWQFWGEALLLIVAAVFLGFIMANLFLPVFNELTGKTLLISFTEIAGGLGFLIAIVLIISLITGGYPALFLSSFAPVLVLKARNTYKFKPGLIKGMVIFQYSLSVFLMISALVMFRQMKFVTTKELGYNQEQLIVIPTFSGFDEEGEQLAARFRQTLQNDADIIKISGTSSPPSNTDWSKQGYEEEGKYHEAIVYKIDYDYLETMGMKLVQGRNFSKEFATDTSDAILVNEAFVKDFAWKNPLGKEVHWLEKNGKHSKIIGVVKDFHALSLESKIEPTLMYMKKYDAVRNILVRISPNNIPTTIEKLRATWKQIAPNKPFDYYFQDKNVAGQYAQYEKWVKIMTISTIMAILIACLGLFGLAGIMAMNKTKEISIRKIFGADVKSLLLLLNKDVVLLAIISFILAMPVSYFAMQKWLNNFAYRIEITWDIPLISVATGLLIALLTVSYQSIRAALMNPVKSLKSE